MYVKYLLCPRSKLALRSELNKLGLEYEVSAHGSIDFIDKISDEQLEKLRFQLLKSWLIPLNEEECLQLDKIIETVIEVVHYSDKLPKIDIGKVISEQTGLDIDSIEKMFSEVKGLSIQQFIDIQKVERVKELIMFEDMTIPEIVVLMDYKNKEQLSTHFKKITGLTPSYFLQLNKERTTLTKQLLDEHEKDLVVQKDKSVNTEASEKRGKIDKRNTHSMNNQPGI